MLSFIDSGLQDICISRDAKRGRGWGIPVPGDATQVQWTWVDALSNYLNALGYGEDGKKFKQYWPADIHVIGKGILRFHAIYWPAFLLSAKLPLPKKIFVHGYINSDGQKMSKSLGNIIDPFELVKKYGTDAVRYFLLREIPSTEDGDFTYKKFEGRYNADLASGLGNLVARVVALAEKSKTKKQSLKIVQDTKDRYKKAFNEFRFNEALISVWELISWCDRYIEKERPWEKPKNKEEIIGRLLFVIEEIAKLLEPFLPETSENISKQLKAKKNRPLFPRI